MLNDRITLLVIVGPTAVGKTKIAIEVAKKLGTEIISSDSMQIYRYMDIGTAKPTKEEQVEVRHHMIDIINPDEDFSVADFQNMANNHIKSISTSKKIPILSGGTGLYINSVCYNYQFSEVDSDESLRQELLEEAKKNGIMALYKKLQTIDPAAAKKIHPNNKRRVIRALEVCISTGKTFSHYEEMTKVHGSLYNTVMIGLTMPRVQLYDRINERVELMFKSGLIDEVKMLLNMGYSKHLNSMQAIGYRQIIEYLEGNITKEEAKYLIARDTRRYAKRQYTWFLRDKNIVWFDVSRGGTNKIASSIINIVEGKTKNT
ncbi:MAG: tRNA (adenosine(37)-N6)-dimethylallyltransferase MiaA [Thermoanaerobacterales bacterium]|nr:tRNA (adenosine(37)-N6)-dimethylallyltransferase MiaA [Thermoanaerobacterales bacterium]